MLVLSDIGSILKISSEKLKDSGSGSPRLDAEILLCHTLEKTRSYLVTWPERLLTRIQFEHFSEMLTRRLNGEPIAYIIGEWEFWSLSLKVSESTLIPRPDTERLVEVALRRTYKQNGSILDLGTGTGAIALSLASEMCRRRVIGVDVELQAQVLAVENARRLNILNVNFFVGSWFQPIDDNEKFSLIVSNPPYMKENDSHLLQGDVRFEPMSALVAKEEGLADIKYIAVHSRFYLENFGWLMLEHAHDQGQAVRKILVSLGYQKVLTEKDYAGNDRVTIGQLHTLKTKTKQSK
ncbi:protein methyltransferase [Candidatus Photodesmus blepharus]|uniref:Release factor glutamine methyltransferase n=1 Tax=Candidatus Photodesmus blepharonis TaxID=1179155 RepID=A0A084CPC6_9GAMM|nr:peptide chain release factor N(5)-glutamine methyltransferase [Candidatus Photodesmus blepharus]KEY91655.1 protein methyltransferase [Candidatus Photodesmus blepharus]